MVHWQTQIHYNDKTITIETKSDIKAEKKTELVHIYIALTAPTRLTK